MSYKVADGLLKIHEINTIDCPFNETIQMKLKKAKQRIQIGMVDPSDFEPTWLGKTAEQLYSMLEAGKPDDEDLVFTHGDFSIANIISNNNEVKGFVDWGRAGISDRHQDLAIAIRSLRHHFNGDSVEAFLDTYGRHKVDTKKVNYYMLLDELF